MAMGIEVRVVKTAPSEAIAGSGGIDCQLPGCATTVSAIASATGGIRAGGLIETDRDVGGMRR